MSNKTVAIIGAGPGGLVAAKTLLHSQPRDTFNVTIFEKSDRIGGIWSVTSENQDGIVPLNMPTNLSQFAVSFSDLAWSSLNLPGGRAHMNPKAWQVNRYLEEYRDRYIPKDTLRLKTEVKSLKKDSNGGWMLSYAHTGSAQEEDQHFDFCILASGIYAKAQPIRCELDGFTESTSPVKIVHSSVYRGLEDILPPDSNSGNTLLVVGGANSGGEVAASLAFDLSNAQYAPGGKDLDYKIVHVLPQSLYGIPLFVPSADNVGAFVPLDVRFYDLSKRPDHPVSLKFGRHTDDSKKMLHGIVQGMLGNDPHELGLQKSVVESVEELKVPKAAIQDNWASYFRSGIINVQLGRVLSLHGRDDSETLTATIQESTDPTKRITLDNIAGVIYATGYTPEPALRILPENIKKTLSYDANYPRLPVFLPEDTLASNPAVPDLGFVGLYEGPYWGVMEMQARQLSARWAAAANTSTNTTDPPTALSERTKTRLNSLMDIRSALKDAPQLVPQYIFSDYLAIMEESARDLALTRNDGPWAPNQGPIVPSRYLDSGSDKTEAEKTVSSLQQIITESAQKGRFVPHVAFRGLQGRWTMLRNLTSEIPEFPTGVFRGEAWFHPRRPTATAVVAATSSSVNGAVAGHNPQVFDQEYLYSESGTLHTNTGFALPTYKNYAWRLTEDPEKISVWFVKNDGRTVDYLYHDLKFVVDGSTRVDKEGRVVWRAKTDHLCEKDMYVTDYTFVFNGVALQQFEVVHQVKGPNKDYTSKTVYTR